MWFFFVYKYTRQGGIISKIVIKQKVVEVFVSKPAGLFQVVQDLLDLQSGEVAGLWGKHCVVTEEWGRLDVESGLQWMVQVHGDHIKQLGLQGELNS